MTWFEPEHREPRLSPFGRVWEATVTAMVGNRPKVVIPELAGVAREFGPCRVLEGPWSSGDLATATGAATAGTAHTHPITTPAALAKGDQVLVVFLGGRRERAAVVGRFFA